jgi:hypothetical protein
MFACVLVFEYRNKQALAELFCDSAGAAHVIIWPLLLPFPSLPPLFPSPPCYPDAPMLSISHLLLLHHAINKT